MVKLLEIEADGGTTVAEAADVENIKRKSGAIIVPSGVGGGVERKLETFLEVIRAFCKLLIKKIRTDKNIDQILLKLNLRWCFALKETFSLLNFQPKEL